MGVDSYTTENTNQLAPGGTHKENWKNGMLSENSMRYRYLSTNLMTNFYKQFGNFNFNLLLGTSTEYTKRARNSRMAWNFQQPDFYSFDNALKDNRDFSNYKSRKRLVGVYGEFRIDWRSAIFLTVTGRNDWSSTLPIENRSYFYPSVSGALVFTELMGDNRPDWLSFGKIRASWAKVGKDTDPYVTNTYLWPVGTYLNGMTGVGNTWTTGNPFLKPEITKSTEVGLEMRFFNNRLHFDYAYYTNNSINQIMEPRLSNFIGYILRKVNAGDVYNKGMELTIGGIPVQTRDFTWETNLTLSGNRGTVKNLIDGVDILYVTDVQVGSARAASFNGGNFMAISGSELDRDPNGNLILDANNMPTGGKNDKLEIGNREPKFAGGWNNTLTWKNWSFNMLWDFRVGGHVYNGTQYTMVSNGTAALTEGRNRLEITGVHQTGTQDVVVGGALGRSVTLDDAGCLGMALQVRSDALNVGTLVGGDARLVHGEVNQDVHELLAVVNHLGGNVLGSVQVVAAVGQRAVGGCEVALELGDAGVAGVLGVGELAAQIVDLCIEVIELSGIGACGSGIVGAKGQVNTKCEASSSGNTAVVNTYRA